MYLVYFLSYGSRYGLISLTFPRDDAYCEAITLISDIFSTRVDFQSEFAKHNIIDLLSVVALLELLKNTLHKSLAAVCVCSSTLPGRDDLNTAKMKLSSVVSREAISCCIFKMKTTRIG